MKLPSLIPSSNLLEQIEGVEAGLRKIQKIGRVGQFGFLVTAILQIVFESGLLPESPPDSAAARAITAIHIGSLLVLPLSLLLFTWSKFWLRQSREPFRYTCSIEPIGPLPHSPKVREIAWLANDLAELLSQRIERFRFVDRSHPGGPAGQKDESHIDIGGTYVVRARDDEDIYLVLEIMPNVGIGREKARKLAYPVSYPPDPVSTPLKLLRKPDDERGEIELRHSDYKALLERVYSSVATEIYRQIQTDVAGKIELMPTRFLQALALFHEAEDYARSNTLQDYVEAGRLYNASARLFDPCLGPLPVSRLRRVFTKLARSRVSLARRLMAWCAPMHLGFARRDIMCARALTGYVNMLLYGRVLASMSGQKINPAFEAQWVAQNALARLSRLTVDAPGCREALFDAHVSLALAFYYLGKRGDAENELATARSLDPNRDRDIRFQMVRGELAPREEQAFRHLVNLAPRLEIAQWSVAYQAERQWRARPAFEKSLAGIPILVYQRVIDLNPGNILAWANRGYLNWLLEECDKAKGCFRGGRDYKLIKNEIFVAELDYGLARIAAEQGELHDAYCCQETAVSDLIAPSQSQLGDFRAYYFDLAGDAVLDRFEHYRKNVEEHLANAARTKGLPARVLNSVYAFVLNDYGECCYSYHERTGHARYFRKAEEAFELASLFDPDNPLALYNLRQLRVRELPTPGRKNEAELEREITAAQAQIAMAQKEKEIAAAQHTESVGTSLGGGQRGRADVRMDALQQEIDSARERIQQAQEQIDNARQQTKEAKRYDQKIRGLHPYWTVGMLREAEMNALEAYVARRDALQEEKAAANSKSASDRLAAEHRKAEYDKTADLLQENVKQNIQALVPHQWLWTVEGNFNWSAIRHHDPLNERRWVKQFNDIHTSALTTYAITLTLSTSDRERAFSLLDHISRTFASEDLQLLRRLRDLSTEEGARTTHTDYDRKMRAISERWRAEDPYSFASLWWIAKNPFTDHERMKIFVDAAGRPDLSGSLYRWLGEDQLLGIARRTRRKRALLEPVAKKMQRLSDLVNLGARPLPELAKGNRSGNGPTDSRLVRALDELGKIQFEEFEGNGIDEDEVDRLQKGVERILADLDGTLDSVRSDSGSWTRLAARNIWEETFQTRELQLKNLLERYREMEEQCGEGALQALASAVTASQDPAILWSIGAQLARFGLFELALKASTTGARIDAGRPEISPDRGKLDQAVRMLLRVDPAEYSTRFREFLELYRQPPARSRTTTEYSQRRCALLVMLGRFDTGDEPFLELKKSEKRWRAAIAEEIGTLASDDDIESETRDRLVAGRAAFRKWLRAEQRIHAAKPEEVADCRMAEITLARDDTRYFGDRTPIVPGAKSLDYLPAVTPLALEIATDLLGSDDGPNVHRLIETLFPQMCERVREDTGVTIPRVRMRCNDTDMPKEQYLIMINEVPLVMGTAYRDKIFVRGVHGKPSKPSRRYSYAAQGSSFPSEGDWLEAEKAQGGRGRERTEVWNHLEYLTRHVEFMVRRNLVQFFGLQEADHTLGKWLETGLPAEAAQHLRAVREDHNLLQLTSRQLQGLLRDRVPLTQPERVAAGLRAAYGIGDVTECRRVLRDSVREQLWGNDAEHVHFRLSDSIEVILDGAKSPQEGRFSLSPEDLQEFFSTLRTEFNGRRSALVTTGERLRYFVRYLIREEWPEVPVLASYELMPPLAYDSLPAISLE